MVEMTGPDKASLVSLFFNYMLYVLFASQNMDYAGSSTAENLIGLLKQIIKCKNQQIITNKIVYKFS